MAKMSRNQCTEQRWIWDNRHFSHWPDLSKGVNL